MLIPPVVEPSDAILFRCRIGGGAPSTFITMLAPGSAPASRFTHPLASVPACTEWAMCCRAGPPPAGSFVVVPRSDEAAHQRSSFRTSSMTFETRLWSAGVNASMC